MTWIKNPEPWMVNLVAEKLGLDVERVETLARHGTIRFRGYRDVVYALLRREIAGHPEGTVVLLERNGARLVPGYPPIQRMVLPTIALPRHFIDKVVVEEKMNGYNVRLVMFHRKLLAVTRGGFICPYTTARLERLIGGRVRELFREIDPETYTIAGEVVGLENPYTRYFYPEAPRFDYFVFDLFHELKPLPPLERNELLEKYGLKHVRLLGVIDKNDVEMFKQIVAELDREGREGVVAKDPEYRVPPLKYTTSAVNIGDVRYGMRFFMEEGRSFLFSRLLRELFRAYEEGFGDAQLEKLALEFGRAATEPALESIRKVAMGDMLYEEFELVFADEVELEEFTSYMAELGVDIVVVSTSREDEGLRARMRKIKDTWIQLRKVLDTGLSPVD
ncbi:RNA ligase [Hyperthermus butylicus]|uniref:Conserved archaeal protein n=1 Tax=Hyperthermus butylicus (strain DSM 5456 / JCM 9403 / PLM1-5) TaxID=415426 RepID=A2BN10_HYPBU|nr:RNA ligase [Hyperthermus butylicus]ABM81371.1 conserved archaeal protein [Hyperthermus butylicus DSM 5456]